MKKIHRDGSDRRDGGNFIELVLIIEIRCLKFLSVG